MTRNVADFRGKVIVVTGGLGVLSQAIARAALTLDARVALIDTASAAPGNQADVMLLGGIELADHAAAHEAFKTIADKLGPIDVLMNVAGAFEWCTVIDGDLGLWERLYRINVLTAVGSCMAAIPYMPSGAAIINVAAAAASKATMGMGAYTAAKSGVLRLTESLVEELKPLGIRINSVSPTTLDTPRNRADMPDADPAAWVRPEDLAMTMLFLSSPEAKAVTGANLLVGA